jgi:hypothetical protein
VSQHVVEVTRNPAAFLDTRGALTKIHRIRELGRQQFSALLLSARA